MEGASACSGAPFFMGDCWGNGVVAVVTVKSKGFLFIFCDADGCDNRIEGSSCDELPDPWRFVEPDGWAGPFHACSDECEASIMKKMKRTNP